MKKLSLILGIFLMVCLSFSLSENVTAAGDKVAICHIPPGNPANVHTIVVSVNAIPAHLAHGDAIGECDPCNDPSNPDC
ncbi:hypothetical protein ATE92_1694 [Ulvibacter sp. MAR_2010_11]|uniref:hypothetical protein n=1 Tax=Ulvibacter sp. MAR_2010_11 TaxID=1250229 RepID=UPI000C2B8DDB|nr:hypothetical protein [Ulvibacter sp. MAR_2010_11]PKA83538.1 hypothetical protein ATE92_1694 [Ulvibacter sp. MAR_2010_11]